MRLFFIALAALMATYAHASGCEFKRELTETLDVSGSQDLEVIAGAGDLVIRGKQGLDQVEVRATICASKQEWADEAAVDLAGGDRASVAVVMPDIDWGVSWSGNRYVYIDLEVDVPSGLPMEVKDSSGDLSIRDTASVSVMDSSGDIEIEGVTGTVVLKDSSGDIEVLDIEGDVTVDHDSSGDIYGRNIRGSVLVAKDSSGDIKFRDVQEDFIVERDSSGSIVAETVGGDFRVLKDGSGSIRHDEVAGEVDIPEKG